MGGVNFILRAQVELTPQELELVDRYKQRHVVLMTKESQFQTMTKKATTLGTNEVIMIKHLIDGTTYKTKDISALLEGEKYVKEACKFFKVLLVAMATFSGTEEFEY